MTHYIAKETLGLFERSCTSIAVGSVVAASSTMVAVGSAVAMGGTGVVVDGISFKLSAITAVSTCSIENDTRYELNTPAPR